VDPDPRIHAGYDPHADPDPSTLISDLQDANKKQIFKEKLFCILLFEGTVLLHHFSKVKSKKKSQNSRNQGFSYYFGSIIKGPGSGSIPLTNGSGSVNTLQFSYSLLFKFLILHLPSYGADYFDSDSSLILLSRSL
jgi:hypothetical protein